MTDSVRVTDVRAATPAEWDAAWRECPHATFTQSREWAETWQAATDGAMSPAARVCSLSDGTEALMPLTRERLPRLRGVRQWSSPAGTYGGWLTREALSPTRMRALSTHVIEATPGLWWRLNPFDPALDALSALADEDDETHAICLTDGLESVCACSARGHRGNVKRAQRQGVKIRRAVSLDDWAQYYETYEDSLRRWGDSTSSRYGWRLFEVMAQRRAPGIELWLTVFDDRVIGGGVFLHAADHVAFWHGATRDGCFDLRPANLLVYAMVDDACRRGLTWFDLNPSGGHAGVRTFKERCGAEPLPSPVVSRAVDRRRSRLAVSAARRLLSSAGRRGRAGDGVRRGEDVG